MHADARTCREDVEGKSAGGLISKLSGVVGGLGGSRHGSRHNAGSDSKGRVPARFCQSALHGDSVLHSFAAK